MITRSNCTHIYHDNLINTQLYSPPNPAGPRVPLPWVHPFDRTDASPSSRVQRRRRRAGAAVVGKYTYDHQSRPSHLGPSLRRFLPRLSRFPGAPPADPVVTLEPGSRYNRGNLPPQLPRPSRSPIGTRPPVRSRWHPSRSLFLLNIHSLPRSLSLSGAWNLIMRLPTHSNSQDRKRSAPVGCLGCRPARNFRYVSLLYFGCYPYQTMKLTHYRIF